MSAHSSHKPTIYQLISKRGKTRLRVLGSHRTQALASLFHLSANCDRGRIIGRPWRKNSTLGFTFVVGLQPSQVFSRTECMTFNSYGEVTAFQSRWQGKIPCCYTMHSSLKWKRDLDFLPR